MREIRFRVWSNEFNQYLTPYGYPNGHSDLWLKCIDGNIYDLQANYEYDSGVEVVEYKIDDIIIEQYTGLKDKNGKEIYEGDKVKAIITGIMFQVVFDEINLCFYGKTEKEIYAMRGKRFNESEIIGNIHE